MSNELYRHPLFTLRTEFLSTDERVSISYQRSKLLMQTYQLTAADVQHCSDRYWALITDPLLALDAAVLVILFAHVGLATGSLTRYLEQRPDFIPLVNRLLRFETVGLFLLSERGHGLDAFYIETTATKTAQGFIINTPREEACKFMPASTPSFGISKIALVMARLIVDGEDRGSRLFIVPICTEREMCRGVESIRLGPRPGTSPLDFSITRFNHVLVPHSALVASDPGDYAAPVAPLRAWWDEVWRIPIGTMALAGPIIHMLKASAYAAARYSMHRFRTGRGPILSFRTQQLPVLHAVAVGLVLDRWYASVRSEAAGATDPRVRHAFAVIVKTTAFRHALRALGELGERCGAQGTLEANFFGRAESDVRGLVIAEGDILALCIRLFSELLQGRYSVPLPPARESLLAWHASALFDEYRAVLEQLPGGHRDPGFNALLPEAEPTVEAMGHAMAYSAACQSGLPEPILDLYTCAVIRCDSVWYAENGIPRREQRAKEDAVVKRALPHLETYLKELKIDAYVSAPIVSEAAWKAYFNSMTVFKGNAKGDAVVEQTQARL